MALLAEWHYLRYQPLTEFFWRELHAAYRMAESITVIANDAKTRYLQVLMLDSVNRSSMSRSRISLLYAWLGDWCKDVALVRDYTPSPYQFFVDLDLACGARPVSHAPLAGDCRYWSAERFVAKLEAMRQQLGNNVLPPDFPPKTTVANAQRMVDKLLSEWSQNAGQRERRGEQRQNVMKHAQVVHGIFNVCQHVKNTGFASAPLPLTSDEKTAAGDSWLIDNESQFGFGTFVYADFNRWLEPGCLIAMNYDLNPDLTPVGIVRSTTQLSAHKYSVGIEVLSHTPSYVRLQQLAETEIGLERLPPVAAIFLPENDERKQPATVAMPVPDYVAAGLYELHTPQIEHVIQLGEVLEQQADWIRVGVSVAAAITL
ncbi:MAG TPA: hypothetical protein VFX01_00935 [Methylophilaceae bacterium]|nr:hypothetical protein [Methylophilaceae bacterium]